jgi:TRAP-type mannitol/chloroaromatic compound transport system permease large subunit
MKNLQQAYSPNMLVTLVRALLSPAKALRIPIGESCISYWMLLKNFAAALVPLALAIITFWGIWWYVVIHQQAGIEQVSSTPAAVQQLSPAPAGEGEPQSLGAPQPLGEPQSLGEPQTLGNEEPQALGIDSGSSASSSSNNEQPLEQLGSPELLKGPLTPAEEGPPSNFYLWFSICALAIAALLGYYYWKFQAEQFQVLKLLSSSVMPLGLLTVVVLAVILFGITTATESAAVGSAGAFLLALQARTLNWQRVKESVFLTAKTTAMVCWLFVGSALFSAVFAILGGQQLVEHWVLALNLSPVQFMLLSQAIIFVLGWPLEWTEIIVIFVPIFLPLLKHFDIDPILWGTLVFVNLQAAFLSPPVAMSAFYLKGVSPPHVTLNQIFAGMMPYMLVVILCMVIMYLWPGMTLWLPNYLYGG